MNKSILIIILSLNICSCKNIKYSETRLRPETVIDQLSDSSFLSDVRSIQFDKYLHITDYGRDQLLIFDLKGRILNCLGMKGKGPGEFLGAAHLFVVNDSIFVYNDGKRSFEIFNNNKHLKTIRLPGNIELSSSFRFFYQDGLLFFSSVSDTSSIVSFDIKSYSPKRYGKLKQFETPKQTRIRNNKHLFSDNNSLFAVSDNLPIIERYDFNGNLRDTFDYSKHPIIKRRLNAIHELKKNPNGYSLLLQDAFYFENKLYLLLYSNLENKISCNDILIIANVNANMLIQGTYHLSQNWYQSICVSDGFLYAFGMAGLEIFRI